MELWKMLLYLFGVFIAMWIIFYLGYRKGYDDATRKSCEVLSQMMDEAKEKHNK